MIIPAIPLTNPELIVMESNSAQNKENEINKLSHSQPEEREKGVGVGVVS